MAAAPEIGAFVPSSRRNRALLETQRNARQVRFLLDARKPILNHGIKLTFEDVCHTLKFDSIFLRFGVRRRLYRIDHSFSSSLLLIQIYRPRVPCRQPSTVNDQYSPTELLQGCSKRVRRTST